MSHLFSLLFNYPFMRDVRLVFVISENVHAKWRVIDKVK